MMMMEVSYCITGESELLQQLKAPKTLKIFSGEIKLLQQTFIFYLF